VLKEQINVTALWFMLVAVAI